jgi:hypothetical protein
MAVPRGTEFDAWCENGEAVVTYGEDDSLAYARFDTRGMAADEAEAYFVAYGDAGRRVAVYAVEADFKASGSCGERALGVAPGRSVGFAGGELHPEWGDGGYVRDEGVRHYYATLNPGDVCTFAWPVGAKCAIEPEYGGDLDDVFRTAESGGLVYALVDLRHVNLAGPLRVGIRLSGEVGDSAGFYHVLGDLIPQCGTCVDAP